MSFSSTLQINVCSLPKNHDYLNFYLSSISHEFSIILDYQKHGNLKTLSTFFIYLTIPQSIVFEKNRTGGGIAILVHKDYYYITRQYLSQTADFIDTESICLEVSTSDGGK